MTTSKDGIIFDPQLEWGDHHILPPIDKSGRWANIPLCPFDQHVVKEVAVQDKNDKQVAVHKPQFFLTACMWASASFSTRGSTNVDTSTLERLLEWLTYQLYMAGVDHIYIYDNSQSSNQTLEPITRLFPPDKVTRIPWKHPVCNNNRPGAQNPGERSSQYAAETSCRVRFGKSTKWMAVLDADEYLIPQAPYKSIRAWLEEKYNNTDGPTKILSFYQTRAVPNIAHMDAIPSRTDPQWQWQKKPEATYLETYNCDRHAFPKPGWAWRAKKQIFQPSYVWMHFVHYSLVTARLLDHPTEPSGLYNEIAPYEKRVDERSEAFLLHTKTTYPSATQYWRKQCKKQEGAKGDDNCPIGRAFSPEGQKGDVEDPMPYNCHAHERVTNDIAPQLKSLLQPLQAKYKQGKK